MREKRICLDAKYILKLLNWKCLPMKTEFSFYKKLKSSALIKKFLDGNDIYYIFQLL